MALRFGSHVGGPRARFGEMGLKVFDGASRNPAIWLRQRSLVALACVAVLMMIHQVILQPALARLTTDAPVINVSGRQRMLSQRLTKAALAMELAGPSRDGNVRIRELKETVAEWIRAHRGLQRGDAGLRLVGANSSQIQAEFAQLEPHFQAIVDAAAVLLRTDGDVERTRDRRAALDAILKHESTFLSRMNEIVGLYETESRARVGRMQTLGVLVMAAILAVLVLVQGVVVRPAVEFVGREFEQSEEQYRRLVESMNDALLVCDAAMRVQFANRRLGEMTGRRMDELLVENATDLFAGSDRHRLAVYFSDRMPGAEPLDLALLHRTGALIETMASPRPMFDVEGRRQGLLLVLTDVTGKKQAEARSRNLLDQLEHANRLKSMGEMAAGLAHEINQPLGAIANFAEGCLAQLRSPALAAADLEPPMRRILGAAIRGGEIIRRARTFSRLSSHHIEQVRIADVLEDVHHLCRPEARRRQVAMEFHADEPLPMVTVDVVQIQQVLMNLIQNAFQAMEPVQHGERRLTVHCYADGDDSGGVQVDVADTGPGVELDDADRLFQPFVTTRAEGTGMGLAISRGIVEAHGGQLWVERSSSGGACFRFTLKAAPPAVPFELATANVGKIVAAGENRHG